MIKASVIKNAQEVQHCLFDTLEAAQKWEADLAENKSWGKPAGFYPISQLSPEELAQEISRKEVDGLGNVLAEALIEIPAQYSVVTEDISLAVAQEKVNQEALAYLASTDWMLLRELDGGVAMPAAIKAERAAARARIVR